MTYKNKIKSLLTISLATVTLLAVQSTAHAEQVYVSDTQNFWIAYTSRSECESNLGASCDVAQSCGPYTVYMTSELANRILDEMSVSTRHTFSVGSLDNEVCSF